MSGGERKQQDIAACVRGAKHLLDHVLVAVGGSESSMSALRHALRLARGSSTRIQVLIVEEFHLSDNAYLTHGDVLGRLIEEAQALMRLRWNEAERGALEVGRAHDHPLEIRRDSGRVADRIVAAAKDATLLAMGKTGCRDEHGGLLGSNTELVVRRTKRPVLLAPSEFRPPQEVLVAHGGKPMGEVALALGLEVSRTLGIPLRVVTVVEDVEHRKAALDRARDQLAALGGSAAFEGASGRVADSILERSGPETLLVMGAYGHSRLYHMVLGSITEELMRRAEGPVLLSGK